MRWIIHKLAVLLDALPVARRHNRWCKRCGLRIWAGERRCHTCFFRKIGLYDPNRRFIQPNPWYVQLILDLFRVKL